MFYFLTNRLGAQLCVLDVQSNVTSLFEQKTPRAREISRTRSKGKTYKGNKSHARRRESVRGKSVAREARGRHTREISHTRDEGKACEGNHLHAKQGEDIQGK